MVNFNIRLRVAEQLGNGKFPIVLQITWKTGKNFVRRKRIGLACSEIDWDFTQHCVRNDAWGHVKQNAAIKQALDKALSIYRNMETWDYKKWSQIFDGKEEKITFTKWAEQLVEEYNLRGQAGTADHYRDAARSLHNYMRKETIYFEEITESALEGLERHQFDKGFVGRRNFVGLKVIIGAAIKRRVIDKELMPFYCGYNPTGYSFAHLSKVKLPKKRKKSKWIKRLNKDTIKVLTYSCTTPGSHRDMDIWRFSYYTMGTDLKDVALMKFSDIIDGLWYYTREKTGEGGLGKPLIDEAMGIVLKYHDPKNKYVFNWILGGDNDDISERVIKDKIMIYVNNLRRRYMKISKELGLDGHFTWRSTRYSSASNAVNRGGNIKDVQVLMDHSNVDVTERYTRYANHEKMREALELLR